MLIDRLDCILRIIVMFWTLILTAPIHCRGSICEQVILYFSKSAPIKKQTHLEWGCVYFQPSWIFDWTITLMSHLVVKLQWLYWPQTLSLIKWICIMYTLPCGKKMEKIFQKTAMKIKSKNIRVSKRWHILGLFWYYCQALINSSPVSYNEWRN